MAKKKEVFRKPLKPGLYAVVVEAVHLVRRRGSRYTSVSFRIDAPGPNLEGRSFGTLYPRVGGG